MKINIALLLPKAIAWAEMQSDYFEQLGLPLSSAQNAMARFVGVAHPELIRVLEVDTFPIPDDSELRTAAQISGILSPKMVGMTIGYGVYILRGHATTCVLSHEFRHVNQYEQAGSVAACLTAYLQQILTVGYHFAPLELDARAHEMT